MSEEGRNARLRALPSIDSVLRDPRVTGLPRELAASVARAVVAERRSGTETKGSRPDVVAEVVSRTEALLAGIRPVINATGVVVHTNLGRAPWSPEALEAVARVTRGYCDLELDLRTGERGRRGAPVEDLVCHLSGAEAAIFVNNNAAAVLLALTALAHGREVVVSRGELVEIGGGFRVPDVIRSGGAALVEVGTTNRTRSADYAAAINANTAGILIVHRSNFRMLGFVEQPARLDLAELARTRGVFLVEDQGSGAWDASGEEPGVRDAVAAGVDVVTFSGDKLIGGPQCGIAVGRASAIREMRRHPLYRALRVDKAILAALGATLALAARGGQSPVSRMLHAPLEALAARADRLAEAMRTAGIQVERATAVGRVGGGAMPEVDLPSEVVRVALPHAARLAVVLRAAPRPVVARVADGALLFDARTILDDEIPSIVEALAFAVRNGY